MKFQTKLWVPAHWETVEHDSILSAIGENGVFNITKNQKGRWDLTDARDGVNTIELSNAQLRELAAELIGFAEADELLRRARGIAEDDDRIFPVMDAPPNPKKP